MQPNYAKLWILLKEKHLRKTDLLALTGLSSRTVAKLSANEHVNTETLAKICTVLQCDIHDIMSFVDKPKVESLYEAYLRAAKITSETASVITRECEYQGMIYEITMTKALANKYTFVKCQDRDILWEQCPVLPCIAGRTYGDELPIYHVSQLDHNRIHLFVINGNPNGIIGLDNGIFRSARRPGGPAFLHVMSLAAFKLFG